MKKQSQFEPYKDLRTEHARLDMRSGNWQGTRRLEKNRKPAPENPNRGFGCGPGSPANWLCSLFLSRRLLHRRFCPPGAPVETPKNLKMKKQTQFFLYTTET